MWLEETLESLTTGTVESLHEDLAHANFVINRTHPLVRLKGDRRAQWIEYRDLILAEIDRRAA